MATALSTVQLFRPAASARRRTTVAHPPGTNRGAATPISEQLFKDALVRERRRADRCGQPFLLALVALEDSPSRKAVVLPAALEALRVTQRDTDVLGWLSRDSVAGLVMSGLGTDATTAAREVESRLRREIAWRLSADVFNHASVRVHLHAPVASDIANEDTSVDTLIDRVTADRSPVYAAVKRTIDIVGSGLLLLLLSPLMLIAAAFVKLTSKGPIFFRQSRVGRMAVPFTMFKFRSMRTDTNATLHQAFVTQFIKSSALGQQTAADAPFKIAHDPRVTRVGRILRKSSIDELPQLWNVLKGDMSLVGPRPPLHYEVEQYEAWHRRRVLDVKPGITGLWQVAGRSRTTFDEMVRLDLRYARTQSVWTDIRILLATPRAVISGKGAC
jgi:exopolysaccharide biosynthesis polyprenyl glycosylphosphotransferase